MHLRHVKYNPNGGPDGGDGGKGGSIILRGNHNYWTLLHLKYERHIFAEHGGNGGKDKCHGTDGKDVYIDVPCGTVVYDAETGKYVCDVTYDGQEIVLLKGGRGGLGNFQFRTATNQAPRYAQPGEPMHLGKVPGHHRFLGRIFGRELRKLRILLNELVQAVGSRTETSSEEYIGVAV